MRMFPINLIHILALLFLIQMCIPPIQAADQYGGTLLTTGNTIDDTGENFNYLFDDDNVKWIYKLQNDEYCEAVAISGDGQYIALISRNILVSPNTCRLWLFNNRGEILWHFDNCVDKIAISADGKYIAALSGNTIYLLNQEGKLLWTSGQHKLMGGDWRSSIKISSDGQQIICTDGNTIISLDRNGKTIASFDQGSSYTPLSVSSDGQYIVTTGDCVDPNKDRWETKFTKGVCMYDFKGNLLWTYDIDTQNLRNAAISADGKTIVFITEYPSFDFHLLNREGILLATIPYTQVGTQGSVAISSDGQVITIWDGPNFVMVDRTGNVLLDGSTNHFPFNVVNYYNTASVSSDSRDIAVLDHTRLYFFQNDLQIQTMASPLTTIIKVPPSITSTITTTEIPPTMISTPDIELPTTGTAVTEVITHVAEIPNKDAAVKDQIRNSATYNSVSDFFIINFARILDVIPQATDIIQPLPPEAKMIYAAGTELIQYKNSKTTFLLNQWQLTADIIQGEPRSIIEKDIIKSISSGAMMFVPGDPGSVLSRLNDAAKYIDFAVNYQKSVFWK